MKKESIASAVRTDNALFLSFDDVKFDDVKFDNVKFDDVKFDDVKFKSSRRR